MDVIQCVPYLVLEAGGTARSVTRLCEHLAANNLNVHLVALDANSALGASIIPERPVNTVLAASKLQWKFYPLWIPEFRKRLQDLVSEHEVSIIHDNGCWLPVNYAVMKVAYRLNVPLIFSPRGMLEPWSLDQSRFRKSVAWRLFQKSELEQAKVLHATSESEAISLRSLGLRQPIAVIPNGVDYFPPDIRNSMKDAGSCRTLLFLSRIHPKKGLLNLVEALRYTLPSDWQVIIAGPDENHHRSEVEAAVKIADLQNKVTFVGPVDHQKKWELYRQADLFVLPSFSENFGNVIAEALAASVPVITTKGAPWHDLETYHCGWWVDIGVEPLAKALRAAMSLSVEERTTMGQNGRILVETKFGWTKVAEKMAAVYRWMLNDESKPDCVLD